MIIRVKFNKKNYLKYISHLDLMRLFQRSFNSCQIPIKYSEGFNPHPKFSIANPLSLGIESEGEYIDIDLEEHIPIDDFINKLNNSLPEDIQIIKAVYLEKEVSISSILSWAFYEIKFEQNDNIDIKSLEERINQWMGNKEVLITRLKKKGKNKVPTEINILPLIGNVVVKGLDENQYIILNVLLRIGENGNLKPVQFMEALNRDLNLDIDLDSLLMKRLELFAEENGNIYCPL